MTPFEEKRLEKHGEDVVVTFRVVPNTGIMSLHCEGPGWMNPKALRQILQNALDELND